MCGCAAGKVMSVYSVDLTTLRNALSDVNGLQLVGCPHLETPWRVSLHNNDFLSAGF